MILGTRIDEVARWFTLYPYLVLKPPLRKGGGLVDAPGRWLVGTEGESPHCPVYLPVYLPRAARPPRRSRLRRRRRLPLGDPLHGALLRFLSVARMLATSGTVNSASTPASTPTLNHTP